MRYLYVMNLENARMGVSMHRYAYSFEELCDKMEIYRDLLWTVTLVQVREYVRNY